MNLGDTTSYDKFNPRNSYLDILGQWVEGIPNPKAKESTKSASSGFTEMLNQKISLTRQDGNALRFGISVSRQQGFVRMINVAENGGPRILNTGSNRRSALQLELREVTEYIIWSKFFIRDSI